MATTQSTLNIKNKSETEIHDFLNNPINTYNIIINDFLQTKLSNLVAGDTKGTLYNNEYKKDIHIYGKNNKFDFTFINVINLYSSLPDNLKNNKNIINILLSSSNELIIYIIKILNYDTDYVYSNSTILTTENILIINDFLKETAYYIPIVYVYTQKCIIQLNNYINYHIDKDDLFVSSILFKYHINDTYAKKIYINEKFYDYIHDKKLYNNMNVILSLIYKNDRETTYRFLKLLLEDDKIIRYNLYNIVLFYIFDDEICEMIFNSKYIINLTDEDTLKNMKYYFSLWMKKIYNTNQATVELITKYRNHSLNTIATDLICIDYYITNKKTLELNEFIHRKELIYTFGESITKYLYMNNQYIDRENCDIFMDIYYILISNLLDQDIEIQNNINNLKGNYIVENIILILKYSMELAVIRNDIYCDWCFLLYILEVLMQYHDDYSAEKIISILNLLYKIDNGLIISSPMPSYKLRNINVIVSLYKIAYVDNKLPELDEKKEYYTLIKKIVNGTCNMKNTFILESIINMFLSQKIDYFNKWAVKLYIYNYHHVVNISQEDLMQIVRDTFPLYKKKTQKAIIYNIIKHGIFNFDFVNDLATKYNINNPYIEYVNAKTIDANIIDVCGVCLEEKPLSYIDNHHMICKFCIYKVNKCPICRGEILTNDYKNIKYK